MKIHRFLVKNVRSTQDTSSQIVLETKENKDLIHQILNVFRFKVGASFVIFNGAGSEFLVEIANIDKKEIACKVKEARAGLKRHKQLTLCFSMIKKENMEQVVDMCTQLGVTRFVPFLSERTVKTGWNQARINKIVEEAVEQSGFSDLPIVESEPMKLEKLLLKFKKEKETLDNLCVLDFSGTLLSSVKHLVSVDTVFVGPEGGFTENEIRLFQKHNIKNISLGANTLRAETACAAVSAIFLL